MLAALLVYQLAAPLPDLEVPQVRLQPKAGPALAGLAVTPPAAEQFAETDARPMFRQDRKGAPATIGDAAPPDIALVGIIADGTDRLALVKTGTSPLASAYRVGASISGWRIVEIAPDRIVLASGPVRSEIRLSTAQTAPKPQASAPNLSNSQ